MPRFPIFNRLFTCSMLACLLCGLSACLGPSGRKLVSEAQKEQDLRLPSEETLDPSATEQIFVAQDAERWWTLMNDATLEEAVDIALRSSWDLRIATTRLAEAQSGIRSERAALLPSIEFDAVHTATDADIDSEDLRRDSLLRNSDLQFNLDWQIDIFRRARTALKAAKQDVAANAALLQDLRRIVTSQVATTYVQLRAVQAQIEITRNGEGRRAANLDRIDSLLERGYATALDFSRAESQLYQSRAARASLEAAEVQLTNQLSSLLGVSLARIRDLLQPGPLVNPPRDAPLPSVDQIIYNRPDVRAAEHQLRSNAFLLNSAKASLYPSLSIGGDIGADADAFGRTPRLDRFSANLFANLAMPLIGRGRLLASVDRQSAALQRALLIYEQRIANALADIDTSLIALSKSHEILEQRTLESNSAKKAAELSHRLFLAGELDYTSVIVAEQTRSNAEQNAVAAQRDALIAYINYVSAIAPIW